jgi:hypothetical protein
MKVVDSNPPNKEHLPIKYTQNIKYNFDFLGLNPIVGLRRKNPLQKEEGFKKSVTDIKFLVIV